jgi:hypothetical protein
MRLTLLTLCLLALLPATASAAAPAVVTGAAESIGQTSVVLTGTVDPNTEPTTYFFEYSTDASFGLRTPVSAPFVGDDPTTVKVRVSGLTAATAYRYRLVATNASGEVRGLERTVTTASPPPPSISTLRATDVTAATANLGFTVNPRGSAVTYQIEYGTTTRFGRRTPVGTLPAGTASVRVVVPVGGLSANRRFYWRVVATNAAGTTRSGRASFTTRRAPGGVTLGLNLPIVSWSETVIPSGRVLGGGVGGITVALEQSTFPFGTWTEVARKGADSNGRFTFGERAVFIATRFRVVTRSTPVVASPELGVQVRSRVSVYRGRRTKRAVRLRGNVWPALPTGRASLQRFTRSGRWFPVERRNLSTARPDRSSYRFLARRLRGRTARYRIAVVANDGGAHAIGYSRVISVGKRRK